MVAPSAGAWIEIGESEALNNSITSRPVRARGLKSLTLSIFCQIHSSRPVRARGLKFREDLRLESHTLSRPVRARGLKSLNMSNYINNARRAQCGRVD